MMTWVNIFVFCTLISVSTPTGNVLAGQHGCASSADCVLNAHCYHPHGGSSPSENRCDCMPGFQTEGDGSCSCNAPMKRRCKLDGNCKCSGGGKANWASFCEDDEDCQEGGFCYLHGRTQCRCCNGPIWGEDENDNGKCLKGAGSSDSCPNKNSATKIKKDSLAFVGVAMALVFSNVV